MGLVQKDAFRTMLISYVGIILGYLNKGVLFVVLFQPDEIGLINLVIAIGTLFAQLANLGTVFTIWKFFPFFKNEKNRHHGFLPFILLIAFVGVLVFTLLYLFFHPEIQASYSEKSPRFNEFYYWVLPIGISYMFFQVLESYLRSIFKNIVAVVSYEIVLRLLTTLLLLVFVFHWIDFQSFVIAHSLLYLIPSLILIVYLYRLKEWNIKLSTINISSRFKRIMLRFSSFFYLNALGVVLVSSLDVMMIAQLIGLGATGIYTTVVFLSSALQVPYRSIIRVSSPLVAEYWKHREFDKMKELYQKVSSICLVVGLGLFLISWLNIDFLFDLLGSKYKDGIWVFFALMMGRLLDMFFGLNGPIFTTSKKYKYELIFTVLLIGIVYGLNLVMIPIWGIVGAAISTSIAVIVYSLGRMIFVYAIYKIHPFTKNQFVVIFLGVTLLLIHPFFPHLFGNKFLQFLVDSMYVIVFFFLPIVYFKLEPETVSYLKKGTQFVGSKFKK